MDDTDTTTVTPDVDGLDPLDRIDKSIDIDASAEEVFALVSRPGWWINTGSIDPAPDLRSDDDLTVLTHAEYGEFRLQTVERRSPSYVSFRWHHRLPDDGKHRSTLVEFHIRDRAEGGVTLRVVESGFTALQKPREEWLEDRSDNDTGWDMELGAARTFLEEK
ncbi:ATPase [Jatrophihabitans sp. YIM 134969]